MNYLMIQNIGIAPVEGFTLLGCSTTRNSGMSSTIGQFGSGTKHAINLLLRKGISPTIFCNHLKMEFSTRIQIVDDGISSQPFNRVFVKFSGKTEDGKSKTATEDLGWVLEHGAIDWNKTSMALREFVSNAIDRTLREHRPISDVTIETVPEKSVRAKDKTTRIFVPVNDEVMAFYNSIHRRFLHFGSNINQKIMEKTGRNLETENGPVIYRKGVYVREIAKVKALFDYNFGSELEIDECRNANSGVCMQAAADSLMTDNVNVQTKILKALESGQEYWETHSIPAYYFYTPSESTRKTWQNTFKALYGENAVIGGNLAGMESHIEAKGYRCVSINSQTWREILLKLGIKSDINILSQEEKDGITLKEPTDGQAKSLNKIWDLIVKHDLTNGHEKPQLKAFTKEMDGASELKGYYKANCVYINMILDKDCFSLDKTMLEEITHHVTGSTDGSKDLQEFLFKFVIKLGFNNELSV